MENGSLIKNEVRIVLNLHATSQFTYLLSIGGQKLSRTGLLHLGAK